MENNRKTIRRPVMRLREDGTPYPPDPRISPPLVNTSSAGIAFVVSPALLFILLLLMAKVMGLL